MKRHYILITGASRGIGKGLAWQFAQMGRHLALCARNIDELNELKQQIQKTFPNVHVECFQLDVNQHDQVFDVFQKAKVALGGLDRVIVNAGIGNGQPLGKGNVAANVRTANTNFVAALVQCEAAMEIFREQKYGHLVTISSVASERGASGNATTYAATKAALRKLSEGLRFEMIKHKMNIKISTILPGFIATDMTKGMPQTPFMVSLEKGCQQMAVAIEQEQDERYVPELPWKLVSKVLRLMPSRLLARVM